MTRPGPQPTHILVYPLVDGFIHHWLTLGPIDGPVAQAPDAAPRPGEAPDAPPDFDHAVELARVKVGEAEHFWDLYRSAPDHWLAWHGFLPTPTHRQAWGFVQLHSAQPQTVMLHCTFGCAARLWLNGQPLLHAHPVTLSAAKGLSAAPLDGEPIQPASFRAPLGLPVCDEESPSSASESRRGFLLRRNDAGIYSVQVALQEGANPLLLRLESVDVRGVALMAALRVEPNTPDASPITIHLPTITPAPRRRQSLEETYTRTRLDRAVYGKRDIIRLHASAQATEVPMQLRLQKASGAIYAETIDTLDGQKVIESVRGAQLPDGPLDAVVMAPFQQFYNEGMRARHTLPILIANQPFHTHPDDQGADARLIELLRAQVQSGDSLYSEAAKMAFGAWEQVSPATIDLAVQRIMAGAADALPDLLALITLRTRMPAYQGFPHTLLPTLDRGLMHFATRGDDTGAAWDAPDDATQLALLAARYLVGQLFPAQGVAAAPDALVAWLRERGRRGLSQWHSQHDLLVMALAPLISLAHAEEVRESAAALLDMLTLAWATHSFGGTFGASRARTTPTNLRSGRFAPEAALMRLLWGVGGYQMGTEAAVALGLAGNSYALPDVIRALALAQPDAAWVQERHQDANLATYRTPDYLLSSVQAYGVGERGAQEQLWQATLGPEAVVFSNHPTTFSQDENAAPGWWVGNGTRPRVAQYHDSLLARYHLPADAWLHFTHAYFPVYAFDEHHIVGRWAFARVGEGYLALWSDPPFVMVEDGPDAGRELRASARNAVWLCQMGRRTVDGDFADFQRKVLETSPQVYDSAVTWTTPRGDTLTLGDNGPLRINGQAAPLDNFPRHNSPFGHADYPAEQLDIVYGEDGLRLRF